MAREVRSVLRRLKKRPGFAAISVLTLALGIGANVAIFSLVYGVLLRGLPYPDSERLVAISHAAPSLNLQDMNTSELLYLRYRDKAQAFEEMGIWRDGEASLTAIDNPTRVRRARVSASLFRVLQTTAFLGRLFVEADEEVGAEPVVVLSHGTWQERFAGEEEVLGRTLELDGVTRDVIGVLPPDFAFPSPDTEVWVPYVIDLENTHLGQFSTRCLARLAPGVTVAGALADLERFTANLTQEFPEEGAAAVLSRSQFAPLVFPWLERRVGEVRRILWVLFGSVGFVLLMACANVANLFLVRAEGRHRELAIRSALGATRWRLVTSFLSEGVVLALGGGLLSLALAHYALRALVLLAPDQIPRVEEVGIDVTVLLFALGLSLVSAVLFALLPAVQHAVPNLVTSLKDGGAHGSSLGPSRLRTRQVLVIGQMALGLVLLVGAGLMVRSFVQLTRVDPGFEPRGALTLRLSLPGTDYETPEAVAAFADRLVEEVEALPGVSRAAVANVLPLTGSVSGTGYELADFPQAEDDIPPVFTFQYVGPGFFEAMGIRLVEGVELEPRDHEARTGAVLISQSIAKSYWPGESALGKRLAPGGSEDDQWYEVVGVVEDVRNERLRKKARGTVYHAMLGLEGDGGMGGDMSLVLRTTTAPDELAEPVRRRVWALDRNIPISRVQALEDIVKAARAPMAFSMLLLLVASGLALLLGGIGVYGVISYLVTQRTQEIGVRMALGAREAQVRKMVVWDGLLVAVGGIVVGLLGALALTGLMRALLYGVGPHDPVTFLSVPLVLVAVALVASFVPALKASRVDPLVALRHE